MISNVSKSQRTDVLIRNPLQTLYLLTRGSDVPLCANLERRLF